ncbi:MAG: hypothetical protein ACO1SV_26840 [Fimbriimonas sp.]
MSNLITRHLPIAELHRLEFMVGEFTGTETLYPPEGAPVQFAAHVSGQWEACERFVKIDFFADIPGVGPETFRSMITYGDSRRAYRMWIFAASQEEPIHMTGNFDGDRLIFLGDPTPMVWGMQRLRYSFLPGADGSIELLGERWEPDGYAKYCSVTFRRNESYS